MTFVPFVMLFAAMILATAGLALWRKLVAMREDDYLHIAAGEEKLIPQQVETANKINHLDRWGEILTVITAAYGLVLAAIYLYQSFQAH